MLRGKISKKKTKKDILVSLLRDYSVREGKKGILCLFVFWRIGEESVSRGVVIVICVKCY